MITIDRCSVLGVRIDSFTRTSLIDVLKDHITHGKKTMTLLTVNAEIMVYAFRHPTYRAMMNSADMIIADSVSVFGLSYLRSCHLPTYIPGADIAEWVVDYANSQALTVMVIVRADGLSSPKNIQQKLHERMPRGKVFVISQDLFQDFSKQTLTVLQKIQPHIILVGLGFPKQEKVALALRDILPHTSYIMTVGGTCDYWTGAQRRAPRWLRRCGLEWLWRGIRQPTRFRRIINAVIVFPYIVIRERFRAGH